MEAGAVLDAGGHGDVHLVMQQLGAVPRAPRARLGPPLPAASALVTGAAHRHFERHGSGGAAMRTAVDTDNGWGGLLKLFAVKAEQAK